MRFLFVDRIVESIPGQLVRGIKQVTTDDTFLTVDDNGRFCFIPSLIGETLGQLAAWNVMACRDFTQRPVAGIVDSATIHRPAYVGETLLLESFINHMDDKMMQYNSVARVGDDVVFRLEGALGPLLPMDDFIDLAEIKQQYVEINHPGDWSALCMESVSLGNAEPIMNLNLIPMSMTFDTICQSQPGVSLIAAKRITRAAPYFADHFPKKPVLPLTILLECKINLAKEFIKRANYTVNYVISELRKIKMNGFVSPGEMLKCFISVKKQTPEELILNFRSEVAGKRVCLVDVVFISRGL